MAAPHSLNEPFISHSNSIFRDLKSSIYSRLSKSSRKAARSSRTAFIHSFPNFKLIQIHRTTSNWTYSRRLIRAYQTSSVRTYWTIPIRVDWTSFIGTCGTILIRKCRINFTGTWWTSSIRAQRTSPTQTLAKETKSYYFNFQRPAVIGIFRNSFNCLLICINQSSITISMSSCHIYFSSGDTLVLQKGLG